ncbi:unnamed protein product, partial [Choristocarpus tenellus]
MDPPHMEVGILLSNVRAEIARASPNQSGGPSAVAAALRHAYFLLQSRKDSASPSFREAFAQSSYTSFSFYLLREVGPTWLPHWSDEEAARCFDPFFTLTSSGLFDVPPSLVLLGLCEGLGRDIGERDRSDSPVGSSLDACTVQRACLFLEPFLIDFWSCGVSRHCRLAEDRVAEATLLGDEENEIPVRVVKEGGNGGCPTFSRVRSERCHTIRGPPSELKGEEATHPFLQVIQDLARGLRSPAGTKQAQTASNNAERVKDRTALGPGPTATMAERLASSLCLMPQKIANALGPLTPYRFSPKGFFPSLCTCLILSFESCWAEEHSALNATIPSGPTINSIHTDVHEVFSSSLASVWRAISGKIMSAGRAGDLVEAWLYAILEQEPSCPLDPDKRHREDGESSRGESGSSQWKDWPDKEGSAVHAWMAAEAPEAQRGALVEALLKASVLSNRSRGALVSRGRESVSASALPPNFATATCRTLIGIPLLRDHGVARQCSGGWVEIERYGSVGAGGASVELLERILLRRALPVVAASVIVDVLAWCDSKIASVSSVLPTGGVVADPRDWQEGHGRRGQRGIHGRGLVLGTFCRVAALWAEPSFLNRSPPRQQELYTAFLLFALKSGALGEGDLKSDPEALILLVRGVGSHLEQVGRESRLQGMRVGEAMSGIIGTELHFDELNGEREDEAAEDALMGGRVRMDIDSVEIGSDSVPRESGTREEEEREVRNKQGSQGGSSKPLSQRGIEKKKGQKRGEKRQILSQPKPGRGGIKRGGKGGGLSNRGLPEDGKELDPDMVLPLGGWSDSDSDGDNDGNLNHGAQKGIGSHSTDSGEGESLDGSGVGLQVESDSDSFGGQSDSERDVGEGGGSWKDFDELEAYDLRDDQKDLAGVAEPVYLEQLLELLRSRDQPDTPEKHETGLRHAEALARRGTPDLPHRAPELCRDLLFLENSFDLQ